jgi:hypothetical protein
MGIRWRLELRGAWVPLSGALLLLAIFPGAAGGAETHGSCDQHQVIHDYARVFRPMPKLHAPPESGQLPFMGGHLYLIYPENEILIGEKGNVTLRYRLKATGRRVPLVGSGVQVSAKFSEVNRSGKSIGESIMRQLSLNSMVRDGKALRLSGLTTGALYRVNLKFESTSGVKLARYGQYFRVLFPDPSADLTLYPKTAFPGDEIEFRVENSGTTPISYARPYSIEKLSGTQWDTVHLPIGPWQLNILRLEPGVAGVCQKVMLPSDVELGSYRIKKKLADPPITLFGRFQVHH